MKKGALLFLTLFPLLSTDMILARSQTVSFRLAREAGTLQAACCSESRLLLLELEQFSDEIDFLETSGLSGELSYF